MSRTPPLPEGETLFAPTAYPFLQDCLRAGFDALSAVRLNGAILTRMWRAADGPAIMVAHPQSFPRDRVILRAIGRTDVSYRELDHMTLDEAIWGPAEESVTEADGPDFNEE